MALLSFWKKDPASVLSLTIEQVVASAGDGKLRDGTACSNEVRAFLREVDSVVLEKYVEHCLDVPFSKSGQVLQDIVNELGRRLDYEVFNGRYQGTTNAVGNDALWKSPEGHAILVEVKTTDGFRVSLDTIAGYRDALVAARELPASNSILIVVGRHDTGELEAQVRGSRHAWDMRLISIDALVRLVKLKENTEEPQTAEKIRSVLRPVEYTRLDALIDVMFSTAQDVENTPIEAPVEETTRAREAGTWEFTDPELLQAKRQSVISALSRSLGQNLVKKTRATYWDGEQSTRVVCTVSKRYSGGGDVAYWYAYHPAWDSFLAGGKRGLVVFGAMDQDKAFAIPVEVIRRHLEELNTTIKPDGSRYWHVKILEKAAGVFSLHTPRSGNHTPLRPYEISLAPLG